MNSETENEIESNVSSSEARLNNPSGDVSMFSETNSESIQGEVGALVELMEQQIDDQNIEIKEF